MSEPEIILVAEDDDTLRFLVSKQLTKLGIQADFARNGSEAVSMYCGGGRRYKLVLMDLSMPEMDGIEATQQIRKCEQEQHLPRTPIVAMTAFSERELAQQAGMDDYMFKPVMLNTMEQMLQKWYKQRGS